MVISDDLRLTLDAVIAGGGISFVSRGLAEEPLKEKKVLAHHVRGFEHFRQRSLVLAKGRRTDPVLQNFIDCIHAVFAAAADHS